MNDTLKALERIRSADTVPSMDAFPTGALTSDALLARIDERSTMTDTLTPIRLDEPSKPPASKRGPLLAIAVAAIVLVVVGVAGFALTRDEGTPPVTSEPTTTVAPTTTAPTTTLAPGALPVDTPALEVVQAWNARWAAGDVEGFEALVDPGASYFADNAGTAVARGSWYRIATGATVESTCSNITAQRIRCETTSISGLTPGEVLLDRSITVYTVADGRIQNFEFPDGYAPYYAYDIEGLERYRVWLRENDPSAFEELFAFGETIVLETEEVRAAHQEQIARFLAAAATD